jgi:riboflavin kinase/FMN adenylyltransferase
MPLVVAHSPAEWTARFGASPTAVTVGNFDGVHLGHREILAAVIERARRTGVLAAAVTFDPHPVKVLRPDTAPALLTTLAQRLALLEEQQLDAALVLRFDPALAALSPQEFVERVLVTTLHARAVFVGGNFRFGHRQAGDVTLLTKLGYRLGFEVISLPPVVLRGIVISSSSIRASVAEGRMSAAARFLGRPFSLAGTICPGTGTGRRLVVPTLNLSTDQELLPWRGVYATETLLDGRCFRSVTNVGFRPTFDGKRLAIESHLLDFSAERTSGPMEIRFCTRLRDEQKFAGPDELRAQIQRDIHRATVFFRRFDGFRRAGHLSRPGL